MFDSMNSIGTRLAIVVLGLIGFVPVASRAQAQCMNYSSQFPFANGLPGGDEFWDMVVHDVGNGPELYVAGEFNGFNAKRVGKWNGTSWSGFANGPGQSGDWVAALAFFDDGTGRSSMLVGSSAFNCLESLVGPT